MTTQAQEKKSFGWQLLLASALVGFTTGLFAGMSESPVATALVGGIFGLIGGGGIFGLLVEGKRKLATAPLAEPTDRPSQDLRPAAVGISLLCVFCILGVFVGIVSREGGWPLMQPEKKDASELTDIAKAAKELDRPVQLKLLILQSELEKLGVSAKQNNQFIDSYIAANKDEDSTVMQESAFPSLKRTTMDAIKAVDGAIEALSKPVDNEPDDENEKRQVKTNEEVRYGDVERAHKYLQAACKFTRKADNYVEKATVPELNEVLDLISRYREASITQQTPERAGPIIRPGKFKESDPKRRLSIKP